MHFNLKKNLRKRLSSFVFSNKVDFSLTLIWSLIDCIRFRTKAKIKKINYVLPCTAYIWKSNFHVWNWQKIAFIYLHFVVRSLALCLHRRCSMNKRLTGNFVREHRTLYAYINSFSNNNKKQEHFLSIISWLASSIKVIIN